MTKTCKRCGAGFEAARAQTLYCPTCAGLCRDCGEPRGHQERHLVRCRACHNTYCRTHRSPNAAVRRSKQRRAITAAWRLQRRGSSTPRPKSPQAHAPDGGLTQAEAARRLGVSRERVRQLVVSGQLPTPLTAEAVEARRRARLPEPTPTPD